MDKKKFLKYWKESKEEPTEEFKQIILEVIYKELDKWVIPEGDIYHDTISHALTKVCEHRNKFNPDKGQPLNYFMAIIRQSIVSYHYNDITRTISISRKVKV